MRGTKPRQAYDAVCACGGPSKGMACVCGAKAPKGRAMGEGDNYRIDYGPSCFRTIRAIEVGEQGEGRGAKGDKPTFNVVLSDDQERAYEQIGKWIRRDYRSMTCNFDPKLLTLGGYAGSGKSTLISLLARDNPNLTIAFVSVTGRATGNMRRKMLGQGVFFPRHAYMTLHSLLYQSFTNDEGKLLFSRKDRDTFESPDLVVIDEASMVTETMLEDLQHFGPRILAVGDHGQLPPVGGSGALMRRPDLRLEKIHRQAAGNPILELSQHIREHGDLPFRPPGGDSGLIQYISRSELEKLMRRLYHEMELSDVATLAWKNTTRINANSVARRILKKGTGARSPGTGTGAPSAQGSPAATGGPEAGDQIICLKNAYRTAFNGMRGFIRDVRPTPSPHYYAAAVDFPDDNIAFQGDMSSLFFDRPKMIESFQELEADGMFAEDWDDLGFIVDYGYCLTVHKAQGSQFDTVACIRERPSQVSGDMFRRWIYTAVTRAEKRLYVLV